MTAARSPNQAEPVKDFDTSTDGRLIRARDKQSSERFARQRVSFQKRARGIASSFSDTAERSQAGTFSQSTFASPAT